MLLCFFCPFLSLEQQFANHDPDPQAGLVLGMVLRFYVVEKC